ncbi:helical backbone metal receptor [Gracilimonas sp. Q87]|uniref:helical backbone metal receptor n=1 Tax=Gracilimonas sp. Q87 TaxID=3384766 RepID=UPI003983F3D5
MPELPYKRIISLVPSLTELLIDMGLEKQLIGRTRFCIHPENIVQAIEIIGGTKNPNVDKIIGLKPDLIISNKEENREEDVRALESQAEIMVTNVSTIEDSLVEISRIGSRTGRSELARKITTQISSILNHRPKPRRVNTAYFIWKDPWMSVGHDTYINDVMDKYGLTNVFSDQARYPTTDLQELSALSPELILLSSEPYPFKEKHIKEIKEHCPDSIIELVNGEWFSWYGSRMIPSLKALNKWRANL